LTISIRVAKSVFIYFNNNLSNTFIQIGIASCVFIGPFLFFYLNSVLKPNASINKYWKYHLIVLFPIILYLVIKFPYIENKFLWVNYFMKYILLQWFIYLLLSGYLILPKIQKFFDRSKKLIKIEIWILNIFFGNLVIWAGYFLADYTSYIVGALSFTLLIYLLVLLLILSKKKQSILYAKANKYLKDKSDKNERELLLAELDVLLKNQKLFKKTELTISEIAEKLDVPSHILSQTINENLKKSFPVLINEYRVTYSKKMILENDLLTLEAIGNLCGFKSKSAFYNAFKKQLKTTPAKYKKENRKQN